MKELSKSKKLAFYKTEQRNSERVNLLHKTCAVNVKKSIDFETLRQIQTNLTEGKTVQSKFVQHKEINPEIKDLSDTHLLDLFEIDQFEIIGCLPQKVSSEHKIVYIIFRQARPTGKNFSLAYWKIKSNLKK